MFSSLSLKNQASTALGAGLYLQLTGGTVAALTVDSGVQLTASVPVQVKQTWNNAAAAFTGLLVDITSTANLPSLLIDLKDDTVSRFSVTNGGTVNTVQVLLGGDVLLLRQSANVLGLRNGAAAQAMWITNTYTDATTNELGFLGWETNLFRLGTKKGSVAGSARGCSLITDNVDRLTISATGVVAITGDQLQIATAKTPTTAADTGTAGAICRDASFIYVCTATNTWKRVAIATW